MPFSSEIFPNEVILNDDPSTFIHADPPPQFGRGLDLSSRGPGEYEYGAAADPFPQHLLIDESEYEARIKEMEEQKTRLSDRIKQGKLPYKNQRQIPYCWIFAPVHTGEILRLQQGLPMVSLSPASAGAQITNFQARGGWGRDGLVFISDPDKGICLSEDWPDTAIDRKYLTEANRIKARDYVITEWIELAPRNKQQLISCLLRRIPVAIGQNHWSHEVTACDALWLDGTVATRIRNQWEAPPWNQNDGFGVQQGSKMLHDDGCAPVSISPKV